MVYYLAQLNVARFRVPAEHPVNADFVNNLDRVNTIAENQEGFVWRLVGEGNNAMDINAFNDPNLISNMSVWEDVEALQAFVYRNKEHRDIMRRRAEWFDNIEFHLVLWWIKKGHIPTLSEAQEKLSLLETRGPTKDAFTFKSPFDAPSSQ